MEWLKGFDLSLWWNALIVVGLAIVLAALAAHERGLIFIGLGVLACGFGELLNHVKVMQWTEPNAYRPQGLFTGYSRAPRAAGLILDGCGIVMLCLGLYRLLAA